MSADGNVIALAEHWAGADVCAPSFVTAILAKQTISLHREAAALRAERDEHAKWRASLSDMLHEAEADVIKLRADREALAVQLGDAIVFMQQAVELGILNAEECTPILANYKQALSAHGGKP